MKTTIAALALLVLSFSSQAQDISSEPIGYYSAGSLRNGVRISDQGAGFMHLFLYRNRGFGALEMINMIVKSSQAMSEKFPGLDRLQIGDIAQEDGGDVSDLHSSHQNGLDADLAYFRLNHREQSPAYIKGFAENMVTGGRISNNFDSARVWEFIKKLHENGQVQRIFVDPVIKKEICRFARLKKEVATFEEVLRSVRAYPNHADHMHVRLRCPPEAKECQSQEDPPSGSGCGGR